MSRPARTWLGFGLCAALAAAALGWATWTALALDRAESAARRRAAFEESVRLALWRMESALSPLLARESNRPPAAFEAFYLAERAYSGKGQAAKPEKIEALVPSPMLASAGNGVLLHFQLDGPGRLISPQAPAGANRELALSGGYAAHEQLDAAAERLARLDRLLDRKKLVAALPAINEQILALNRMDNNANANANAKFNPNDNPTSQSIANQSATPAQPFQQDGQAGLNWKPKQVAEQQVAQQKFQSEQEWNRRSANQQRQQLEAIESNNPVRFDNNSSQKPGSQPQPQPQTAAAPAVVAPAVAAPAAAAPAVTAPATILTEGPLQPMWVGAELLLARRAGTPHGEAVQGCWLDWPALKLQLLGDIRDLLPAADLVPAQGGDANRERTLAVLPVRLVPGPVASLPEPALSPMKLALLAAWAGMALAAAAVASLLAGAVSLSERRGAFVSAVTHELRSPLTTFRMYTEMLSEGMVREGAKRESYIATLRAEADRLGHLVENVLAYSRLEGSKRSIRAERLEVGALLARAAERPARRAAQAGMDLVVSADGADNVGAQHAAPLHVRADPAAVEQILFNLVDNACKYAGRSADKRVRIEVTREGRSAVLRVRDAGPGVSADVLGKLFRPFSRSASEAAGSAPGVGLGLALSRQLARQMGGDLRLESADGPGACFALSLPLA